MDSLVASIKTVFMQHSPHDGVTESSRIILRQVMTHTSRTFVINMERGQMLNLNCVRFGLSIWPRSQNIFSGNGKAEIEIIIHYCRNI